ncbi:hypothetical protein HAX54_000377 [Datura stramonium]|uniref:Uncharacterized protein n=1 Tax=Datura stramonium TaxID=4076 RepID=A0ABS8RS34_DATST|nr:hypothetical protein [Datura stramonium]
MQQQSKNHLHQTASSIFKDNVLFFAKLRFLSTFSYGSGSVTILLDGLPVQTSLTVPFIIQFSGTRQVQTTYTTTPISVFPLPTVLEASPLTDFVPVRNYASILFISYNKGTCSQARSALDFLITSI